MTKIFDPPIIPVAAIESAADAVPVARALQAGGLNRLELTLRTPAALESIRAIRDAVPEFEVGAGTVLTAGQVDDVIKAGAFFAVSPGLNPGVVRHAQVANLPFYPGVMTPSDVERGLELNCMLQKLFPATVAGGIDMIKALAGPYLHTGLKLIPLGGIDLNNMNAYLEHPMIAAIGGSWLVDKKRVAAKDWDGITRLAGEAVARAKTCRMHVT